MMRGRIVKIGDVAAADFNAKESAQWALEGDRGVTFAAAAAAEARRSSRANGGRKDYKGPAAGFARIARSPTGSG